MRSVGAAPECQELGGSQHGHLNLKSTPCLHHHTLSSVTSCTPCCCRQPLERVDVPVGPGKQDFIHTVLGGDLSKPPLVMAPGYAAGLGFYWR